MSDHMPSLADESEHDRLKRITQDLDASTKRSTTCLMTMTTRPTKRIATSSTGTFRNCTPTSAPEEQALMQERSQDWRAVLKAEDPSGVGIQVYECPEHGLYHFGHKIDHARAAASALGRSRAATG